MFLGINGMTHQHHEDGQPAQAVNEIIVAVGAGVHMPRLQPVAGGLGWRFFFMARGWAERVAEQ